MKKFVTTCIILFFVSYILIIVIGALSHLGSKNSVHTNTNTGPSTVVPTTTPSTQAAGAYTTSEIANHNSASSCWLIVSGKVYDVSAFISSDTHRAGNNIIIGYCGTDATDAFGIHNQQGYDVLAGYYIGTVK